MNIKNFVLAISAVALASALSFSAQAQPAAAPAPAANVPASGQAMDKHPCHVIAEACKSAGFVKGGYKTGKGLFKNCMKPIMAGQAVSGVNVNPADVQACQARHQEHSNK